MENQFNHNYVYMQALLIIKLKISEFHQLQSREILTGQRYAQG